MTYEIHVYCDGRKLRDSSVRSHADQVAKISRLYWVDAGEDDSAVPGMSFAIDKAMWTPHPYSRTRYNQLRSEGLDAVEPDHVETIADSGGLVDLDGILASGESVPAFHHKFVFRCDRCGQDYQRNDADIAPVLDRLRLAGIRDISLTDLGARLSR